MTGADSGGVAVVIPASGRGTRLGGAPKQFRLLGGAPMLLQTLRAFESHPEVTSLVVATLPEHLGAVRAWGASLAKLRAVVPGGASRQASVEAGLRAVPESTEWILVHDAARPFIGTDAITRVLAAIRAHGAAALAVPLSDTLRRGRREGEAFGEAIPRDGLWRMQTPQGARADWLRAAHDHARAAEAPAATDDVALLQAVGHPVHIVEGDPDNDKITTPADWARAESRWARRADL